MTATGWHLDMGAQVVEPGRVRFRVWAPDARAVEVETYPPPEGTVRSLMERDDDGVWSAGLEASPGALYRYRLNHDWGYPDPYSRSQPEGVHGPSQVVDPGAFHWTDGGWRGLDQEALVVYECHVGACTPEGTFDALIGRLDGLRDLGVTAVELMPVAEFPGRRNWGYEGVDLFAASSAYGGPEALRRLVDAVHARGLGVILDVVYNHLGPDGNYLHKYARDYFTDRYQTPWGDAVNFDGPNSRWVRHLVVQNALYWLHEFHIDGFRLDATEQIHDRSETHILAELGAAVESRGPDGRSALLIAENEWNELRIVSPRDGSGYGLDGIWIDDFHHSVHVMLTGERPGYLGRYEGTTDEIAALLRDGLLYEHAAKLTPQGAEKARSLPVHRFVYSLQNHDQVGNRPFGDRFAHLVGLERYKAACALLLLAPYVPLLFMGDEFAASTPFLYFTDHEADLGERIAAGRRVEFKHFYSGQEAEAPDPQTDAAFAKSKLDLSEREQPPHDGVYRLFQELLRLRREDPVLRRQDRSRMRAEAPSEQLLGLVRWNEEDERRLLLVNFGDGARFDAGEHPWLGEADWRPLLSTAEERFAGPGVELGRLALRPGGAVELPARCAVLWAAEAP